MSGTQIMELNSWAAFPSAIDISNGNTVRRGLAEIAQPFFVDLTCDVIGGPDGNETWFPLTNFPGLSNVLRIFFFSNRRSSRRIVYGIFGPFIEVLAPLWNIPPHQPGKYVAS